MELAPETVVASGGAEVECRCLWTLMVDIVPPKVLAIFSLKHCSVPSFGKRMPHIFINDTMTSSYS